MPASVNVCPPIVTDCPSHIVLTYVLVLVSNTVKFNRTIESQPKEVCSLISNCPEVVNVVLFNTTESPSQIILFNTINSDGFTVRFKVTVESQPSDDCKTTGKVPDE